jgi:DNA repair protein RecN (Recombination protein N)
MSSVIACAWRAPVPSTAPARHRAVLEELRVENLLLIEAAQLRFAAGLNVLTGETGAGKTLLAQALDLLLGARARAGLVREGAAEAYVEGIFTLPGELERELAERLPADASELVLARRVWPDGRSRAYLCGRAATLAELRELGGRLLSFYGQHEHRRLMLATAQLEILDRYAGSAALELRARVARAWDRRRALAADVGRLAELAGSRVRELDLARFELEEIEAVAPEPGESERLAAERERLRNLQLLRSAALGGAEALVPDDGEGVAATLAAVSGALGAAASVDAALAQTAARVQSLRYEVEDIAGELRVYLAGLEEAPGELERLEERLGALVHLERKHGGSLDAVLAHAQRCRERIAQLEGAEDALQDAQRKLAACEAELARLCEQLRAARRRAAPQLARAVQQRLGELAMARARFEVRLSEHPEGLGPRGADAVELMLAAAPGLPLAPLREVASGGELSRVMLALLGVAQESQRARRDRAGDAPALVFDEIDAGIGGHTARAVGEHLRQLAGARQVLCITHLPQVAALAQRHFTITRDERTTPARTTVRELAGEQVVAELVRMLGAGEGDAAASRHARELLRAA